MHSILHMVRGYSTPTCLYKVQVVNFAVNTQRQSWSTTKSLVKVYCKKVDYKLHSSAASARMRTQQPAQESARDNTYHVGQLMCSQSVQAVHQLEKSRDLQLLPSGWIRQRPGIHAALTGPHCGAPLSKKAQKRGQRILRLGLRRCFVATSERVPRRMEQILLLGLIYPQVLCKHRTGRQKCNGIIQRMSRDPQMPGYLTTGHGNSWSTNPGGATCGTKLASCLNQTATSPFERDYCHYAPAADGC